MMESKKHKVLLTAWEIAHIQHCPDYTAKNDPHRRIDEHRNRIKNELTAVLQTVDKEE